MKTSAQLRQEYLGFFQARGHTLRPSAPLIPKGDPSLIFNSAGMVPFKPYFLGLKKDLSRATTCQKCFRTTDIDRVGQTLRHLTFFEMLGNFSFGDYFKAEAIPWAWDFLTGLGLDTQLLHPTVFREDDEAAQLWSKQPLKNPVIRLDEDNNFWAAGPTGPCGPCSEIYFDRGPKNGCGKPSCAPGCDCDRYLEIWNLVFMQFDRQADGSLKPLPRRNIDTGMGLERLAFVLQGKTSPFDTDLFAPIQESAKSLLPSLAENPESVKALRVISDHARAAVMLMSEGVIPSNVERGYVLRRLIRRAVRYGQLLGRQEPFLYKLVPSVLEVFQSTYPEISGAQAQVTTGLKMEEERFRETLAAGERELKSLLEKTSATLSGAQAFKLYDTFGFPLELTREICASRGISVDEEDFALAQEKAVELARASWQGSGEKDLVQDLALSETVFTGHESLGEKTRIAALRLKDNEGIVILERTPFYAEGGGQVGDTGEILSADGRTLLAEVVDTQKRGQTFLHLLKNVSPKLKAGLEIVAQVDEARRDRIRAHHTATHLLNAALRKFLGGHVRQAGSFVDDKRLRFDFTHPKAVSSEELVKIEAFVNAEIKKSLPVETKKLPAAKAAELGATTLLGEDYGETPRFVLIAEKGWQDPSQRTSLELCGGTHTSNTSQIAAFKIIKESSVAAGIRRIEALAGPAVDEWLALKEIARKKAVAQLLARQDALIQGILALGGKAEPCAKHEESALRSRLKELENSLGSLKTRALAASTEGRKVLEVKGLKLHVQKLQGADPKSLRGISDKLKTEIGSGVIFLAAPHAGKISFILAATADLTAKGFDAGACAKKFTAAHGGSGGGRPDFAQGGVPDGDWDKLVASLSSLL